MLRLRRDDFHNPDEIVRFARTCGVTPDEFRRLFEYLVRAEPPPIEMAIT